MQLWNVPKNLPKNSGGFTLVEMLATAVVISVVAAVAVPNLLGMINNAHVSDGMADIEGAIKEAKRQAIRNSQTCVIQITTNSTGNFVVQTPTGGGFPPNNNRCLLETRTLPDYVNVTRVPTTAPDTIWISSKGNIDYTNNGNNSTVTNNREFTISHDDSGTVRCVRVEGLFGDVQNGIVQGGTCDTNL